MEFPKLKTVEAIKPFILHLEYEDGSVGDVDLSALKGKGVFKWWNEAYNFGKVYIDKENQAIKWNADIELDPDAFYLKIRQVSFDEWKSQQEDVSTFYILRNCYLSLLFRPQSTSFPCPLWRKRSGYIHD